MRWKPGRAFGSLTRCGLLLITINLLVAVKAPCQKLDSIKYVIPDNIAKLVKEHIKRENAGRQFYAIVAYTKDTTSLLISTYASSPKELYRLVSNTNHFLVYDGGSNIPLLLQEDLVFSSGLHRLVNKGKPNESVTHVDIQASGYSIRYRGTCCTGTLIKAEYFQR